MIVNSKKINNFGLLIAMEADKVSTKVSYNLSIQIRYT